MASIRVLVADDSEICRELLAGLVAEARGLVLCGTATNGEEAVLLTARLRPDVIAMDVKMPVLDGIDAVARIMNEAPTPILMLTGSPSYELADLSFRALRQGALDLQAKPVGPAAYAALADRLRLLATVPVVYRPKLRPARCSVPSPAAPPLPRLEEARPEASPAPPAGVRVVALVASTGGPAVLGELVRYVPSGLAADVLIVQHMSPGFDSHLAAWLDRACPLPVRLAETGEALGQGRVWIAPTGAHLRVDARRRLILDGETPPYRGHRPAGNVLLQSLATHVGRGAVGAVLTGMGDDGAAGLLALRQAGGTTVAQDAAAAVDGMPKAARDLRAAEHVLSKAALGAFLQRLGETTGAKGPAT